MDKVFDRTLSFTREDNKKNIPIPFFVPEGVQALRICFSYSPKLPDDREEQLRLAEENIRRDAPGHWGDEYDAQSYLPLKNLLTLSLDDPFGYRGAAHRQDPEQEHWIREDSASPGFLPGKLPEGSYRLTVSVHALVTETCEAQLLVEAVKRGEDDV